MVCLFAQGRVNYTGQVGPCKHGIGKVVCDAVKDGGRRASPRPLPLSTQTSSMPPLSLCEAGAHSSWQILRLLHTLGPRLLLHHQPPLLR